jgi:nucleotide-binding universal stress UspA family protein
MNPLGNILLAIDFSEHSNITIQSAISFCKENKSTLSFIHVITVFDENLDKNIKESGVKIDQIVKEVQNHNITVPHTKVATGNIEENVVNFAESINASAILIGSGNYHHNKKHRLGGHAEAILRQSSVPVLIVKDSVLPLKGKIACPIDLTQASDVILESAIDYTKHVGGELVIIHAVEPAVYGYPGAGFDYVYAERNFFEEESKSLDEFLKTFDFKGVHWSKKILLGAPGNEISEYIKKFPFSMTIMGSSSRSGLSRLILGSVAEVVTRSIDSPCLVIKKGKKSNDE